MCNLPCWQWSVMFSTFQSILTSCVYALNRLPCIVKFCDVLVHPHTICAVSSFLLGWCDINADFCFKYRKRINKSSIYKNGSDALCLSNDSSGIHWILMKPNTNLAGMFVQRQFILSKNVLFSIIWRKCIGLKWAKLFSFSYNVGGRRRMLKNCTKNDT